MVMRSGRPQARVVATEVDPVAAACARRNGVVVYEGHLDEALPAELASRVDVITWVLPYVPRSALQFLPRDVQRFEPRHALDGGERGLELTSTVVARSPQWIRPGGWLLLEVGSDQIDELAALFEASGYADVGVVQDGDGDPRGIYGQLNA
jgi:release factor glutamine methyltransferase